ncbi:response regulator transcription factor [Saccharopolyspora erythraea]|uniref:response regulator n=1 Tax=Saccharopolyspora erythraea TaxID=1836 RepID=UPI001BABF42E|nr:response regulator transcription factor [Saccharopolyspora erythraea]QUH01213.1 response regulator transcription factor [Saccharopolyspora erythraea]
MTRILLAEDEQIVRAGLRKILESAGDITVIAEAGDGAEAVTGVRRHAPDVVVMDIQMPRLDGLAATRQITSLPAPPKILILTMFDFDANVYSAIEAGASGFLLKDARPEELINAIRVIAEGDAMLSPSVTRRLLSHFADRNSSRGTTAVHGLDELTPRERQILSLVGGGLSNASIAKTLGATESTVKGHVSRLLMKLDCENRVQLALIAHNAGIASEQ